LSGSFDTLTLTFALAVLYVLLARLIDANEKEPLWALGLFFGFGMAASAACVMVAGSTLLELTVVPAAVVTELGRLLAITAGLVTMFAIERGRGWSEFNGLLDGIVYGVAAGCGTALGRVLVQRLLASGGALEGFDVSFLTSLKTAALSGLSDAVFGAIIGAGFGAALEARSSLGRLMSPLVGFLAAILMHSGYLVLAHGNALSGAEGLVRAYAALALPVVILLGVGTYAFRTEKQAIRAQLGSEDFAVTKADLSLLDSFFKRQLAYLHRVRASVGTSVGTSSAR
jgi:RsiW-degrading membrane proteinase PrsW (M82 family)